MADDNPVKALLLVAHGSRRETSNQEIRDLAHRLRASQKNRFDMVSEAYLELAEPSIPDGIERCIEAGATQVIVYPYFLSAGRHVAEDIPLLVKSKRLEHPQVEIVIADYLGAAGGLPDMIFEQLEDQ